MKSVKLLTIWLALLSAQAFAQDTDLRVWMDKKVDVTADGTTVTKLTVYEYDKNVDYIAFNMVITVPEGVKVNKIKSGRETVNDIELSVRATTTHSIACNMPDDGNAIKIIATSTQNLPLYSDDEDGNICEPLFTIGLIADNTAYNGEYQIELTGCRFVYKKDDEYLYKDLDHTEYADLFISGGTDFPGLDYTLSSVGCGTLILPFDCEIPEGMEVYSCVGFNDKEQLLLSKEASFTANTPYIIRGNEGEYHFEGTAYKALNEYYSTDYMTGVYVEKEVPENAYVMQNHVDTYGLGFYKVGRTVVTITPYHCFLNAFPDNSARMLKLSFDDSTTDIKGVLENEKTHVNVYNIQGQAVKISVPKSTALDGLNPGIYIINGKKYVKK